MKLVLLIGSALRKNIVDELTAQEFPILGIGVPAGPRFRNLASHLTLSGAPQAKSLRKAEVAHYLEELAPDAVLCVGWPFLFQESVLQGDYLLLNSHPTLLPAYRGPSPWADMIANGEKAAGVTVHAIEKGMDTGPILHQERIELSAFDTYMSLRAKLVELEPRVIVKALSLVRDGETILTEQDEQQASTFPKKRTPRYSEVNPAESLTALVDQIRACDPESFPAYFYHCGQKVHIKLWRSEKPDGDHPDSL